MPWLACQVCYAPVASGIQNWLAACCDADALHAGNAWTDPIEDNKGAVDFWYSHALISEETRDGIFGQCNFSRIGPLQVSARVESAGTNVRPCQSSSLDCDSKAQSVALQARLWATCNSILCAYLTEERVYERGPFTIATYA